MTLKILLSFDVEEFDLPLEYNVAINMEEQMQVGFDGLQKILPILNNGLVKTTLFTTANFANEFANTIKSLSDKHEIASHTFYHTHFDVPDLLNSKLALEKIINKPVIGLRMPRMRKVEVNDVINAGYTYDSSIHPTWLPGRYNNLNLPRTIYTDNGLLRIPASVSKRLRIPLFWLAFKNYPYSFFKKIAIQTLQNDGYLCLYFHPWEFTSLKKYAIPNYIKKDSDGVLLKKLQQLIEDLKPYGDFSTIQNYCLEKHLIN